MAEVNHSHDRMDWALTTALRTLTTSSAVYGTQSVEGLDSG